MRQTNVIIHINEFKEDTLRQSILTNSANSTAKNSATKVRIQNNLTIQLKHKYRKIQKNT